MQSGRHHLRSVGISTLLCHDAEVNPRVDLASCRRLGARSILVAPLRHYRRTLGLFEVLSGTPYAFDPGMSQPCSYWLA